MNIIISKNSQRINSYHYCQTSAGCLRLAIAEEGIVEATFVDETAKDLLPSQLPPLVLQGTDFQIKVWQATARIPAGTTVTYQDLARTIGHPKAVRAVANALGSNKIAYFIPCHRVVRTDGGLGGYAGGIERKVKLLAAEGVSGF